MKRTPALYAAALVETALTAPCQLGAIAQRFLGDLRRNKDTKLLTKILSSLEPYLSKREGIVFASAQLPLPPSPEQITRLKKLVGNLRQTKKVELKTEICPELETGFKLTTGDFVIDNTLTGKLTRLKNQL